MAQTPGKRPEPRFTASLGVGDYGLPGFGGVVEAALQIGPQWLALRGSGLTDCCDGATDVGVLIGLSTQHTTFHVAVAAGLGVTMIEAHFPTDPNGVGLGFLSSTQLLVMIMPTLGIGVQAFGNVNGIQSFFGGGLALQVRPSRN